MDSHGSMQNHNSRQRSLTCFKDIRFPKRRVQLMVPDLSVNTSSKFRSDLADLLPNFFSFVNRTHLIPCFLAAPLSVRGIVLVHRFISRHY